MSIDRFVVLVFIWIFICLQIQTAYIFRLLPCVYAYWLPVYCHLVIPYILPFINYHICSYILLVCRYIFRVHIDEFIVGQIIFFGCVQMKHIAGINNKKNEPKVLIRPYTPIYLRFCRFVVYFITPIMCNKTVRGISAKKNRYIALEKRGGACYGILTPGYRRYNHYSVLYIIYNVITFCVRPAITAICYQRCIISAKRYSGYNVYNVLQLYITL